MIETTTNNSLRLLSSIKKAVYLLLTSDSSLKVIHTLSLLSHYKGKTWTSESLEWEAFNCNSLIFFCSYRFDLTACKTQTRRWEVAKKVSLPSVLLAHMKQQRSNEVLCWMISQPIGRPLSLDRLFHHSCNLSCICNCMLIQTRRFISPRSSNLPHVA